MCSIVSEIYTVSTEKKSTAGNMDCDTIIAIRPNSAKTASFFLCRVPVPFLMILYPVNGGAFRLYQERKYGDSRQQEGISLKTARYRSLC